MKIRYALLLLACCLCVVTCKKAQRESKPGMHNSQTTQLNRFHYNVIVVDGGFGYDLYVDSTLYVHQVHIPAVNGLFPFATEADAAHVADIAIRKMEEGIIPPTISVEELQAAGIVLPVQN